MARHRQQSPNTKGAAELEILKMTHTDKEDLMAASISEVRSRAREAGIGRVESMNRPALVEALWQHAE